MFPKTQAAVVVAVLTGALSLGRESQSAEHAWYVDCTSGSDAADGRSQATAWKSTGAVNARTFQSGDAILLRRGSVCSGMLTPKGSGSPAAAIRLDAWGSGALPQIRALPGQQAAFKLFDQEYWTIQHLDFSGGEPYGIFVSGTKGILNGIHIRDVVVHDVTGEPKNKESGLVVIASGTEQQHFNDVLIDGVTAAHTTQWAGIMVAGVAHGFPPESSRNTNVIIRNSIVYDVAGDGIVLFQVNNGVIENSAAWLTGMQKTESIGTPNAIWTWMCRKCVLRHNEAFLTDSPGVDAGAFDIDYGTDDNLVEENYGHDTQGYCVAVFGAGWQTRNGIVRDNVCAANGLSPRLARAQGAVYIATWNGGSINGLEISGNRLFWKPAIAAAAVVNIADFQGIGTFEKNTIYSCSSALFRSNASLAFRANSHEDCREDHVQESQRLCLRTFVSAREDGSASRGQIALLESIHRQFPKLEMRIVVADADDDPQRIANLRFDWNAGDIALVSGKKESLGVGTAARVPALILTNADGKIVWRHDGFTPPGELGLELRSLIGNPRYSEMPLTP